MGSTLSQLGSSLNTEGKRDTHILLYSIYIMEFQPY